MRLKITATNHQWIVNTVEVRGEDARDAGDTYLKAISYHLTLSHALKWSADYAAKMECPEEGFGSAEDVERALSTISEQLEKLIL